MDNIYTENILDHYENPCNHGSIEDNTISVEETNPLCGDELKFDLKFKDKRLEDIKFSGQGCAISQAASSMLTELAKGRTQQELKKITRDDVYKMLGISISPGRVKCALIGYVALQKALTLLKINTHDQEENK